MSKRSALLFLVCTLPAFAQSTADSALLQRLASESAAYRNSLPSFNCEENVVATIGHSGKIDRQVDFTATLRVLRDPADGTLRETYNLTSYLGLPLTDGTQPRIPLYVQGGFGKGVPSFFAAGQQACYRYSIDANRVRFTGRPGPPPCDDVHTTAGFADLDAQGNITHGETRLPLKEADKLELTTFAAVDYAAINLDGRPFRLPIHLYAEKRDGKDLYTFDAHYSHCKLFHATIRISPASSAPPPDSAPTQPPPHP